MLFHDCQVADASENSTSAIATGVDFFKMLDLIFCVVYVVQGVAMTLGGAAIGLAILAHKGLRSQNEYILILGMAVFPAGEGLAFFTAALYRGAILIVGIEKFATTKLYCWLMPFNQLWTLFMTSSSLALCAVSFDRLLLVYSPAAHKGRPAGYGWAWFISCFAHGFVIYVATLLDAWRDGDDCASGATLICYSSMGRHPLLNSYLGHVASYGALLSVLLFALALLLYRRRTRSLVQQQCNNGGGGSQLSRDNHLEDQRRLTTSFALSAAYTLFLYVIPVNIDSLFSIYLYPQCSTCGLLTVPLWITANFNPILNVYIFLVRQREIRTGFLAALRRNRLPRDVRTWRRKNELWAHRRPVAVVAVAQKA